MILDATAMGDWQACKRKYVLGGTWRVIRWRPKALFDSCLRQAVVLLGDNKPAKEVSQRAQTRFMEVAANPGLDVDDDPYIIAQDYCAMLDTIIYSLSRTSLPEVKEIAPIKLAEGVEWRTSAWADSTGTLHRWITVDHWGQADLAREFHSWWVIGDIAINTAPMTLHVIEIGQIREGRRASPWVRGYKHPTMPGMHIRFKRTDGSAFASGWKPCYLADHSEIATEVWVEQMWREGVAQERMHSLDIRCPSEPTALAVRQEIIQESEAIRGIDTSWSQLPMSRNACDLYVPCPFQSACYAKQGVELGKLGIYQSKLRGKAAHL